MAGVPVVRWRWVMVGMRGGGPGGRIVMEVRGHRDDD